ncbi:putative Urea active transporter [Glarea lozoyensis 74030]|uniref:Putative Urea active transporter n=1 Tax=Glarea lozoyensis (strain ATCC 74030 / MF5533) TaxID=1104152 RepID=H0ETL4_GLAL7|nr:putative Urea active transporter [Glarea lozoyensis 74030]
MATETIPPTLPQGAGYGVVVGIGFFFAFLMAGISYVQSCKVKQNAPRCHTFLEIIQKRYGTTAHIVFIFFALFCNILVASQLLLGGSAVVTALTGMNVYAAIFLIPLGVVVYVVLGGLRATFLFYTTNPLIGSPDRMYEILTEASKLRPVAGNQDGSYLTLKSNFGLIFGVIQLCSGMGTVFLDQGYWQRAIASRPTTAVRAYIMGGMAWFAIPFGFATTLGLAAVALTDNPSFPTYPNPMSTSQVSSGLAAPFGAVALLGNNGAIALLITLFMAVTSSSSSELIAVSSILTFDIYKMYINPSATPSQLIKTSHYMICFFGFVMAAFACIWNAIGIDLGWLFLTMGLLIGGGVFPAAFAVTWKKQSKWGAITGAVGGLACGLTAWLVTAHAYYGELTIATTGANYPTLAGNLAAVLMGCLITVTVSLVKPDNFDWEITRSINAAPQIIEAQSNDPLATSHNTSEKPSPSPTPSSHTPPPSHTFTPSPLPPPPSDDDAILTNPKLLNRSFKYACYSALILTLLMDFIIPIPMFLSHYIFSRGFFLGWIVIGFLWVAFALGVCGILPVWEGRGFLGGLWGRR